MKNLNQKIKKIKLAGISLIAVMLLASCSEGSNEPAKVKPEKTKISGALSDYLEVVDGEYEIVDDWGGNLNIKIMKIKEFPENLLKNKEFDLTASVLQENGMPISGTKDFELDYKSKDKIISLLKGNSEEEIVLLKTLLTGYNQKEHAEKSKKFSVSSIIKEKKKNSSTTSSLPTSSSGKSYSNSSSETSTSNEDWDKVLKSYENYIDQYIKLMKKAQKGDMSVMTEYAEMMEKANDLSKKMNNAGDDLSASQMSKFMKLQTKLASAATNF